MNLNFIIELEKNLLDPSVRKDASALDRLLDNSFVEFGTSGKTYDKQIILERLLEEDPTVVEAYDFERVQLASDW